MSTEQERIDALADAIIDYETACGSLDETTAEGYARLFLGSSVLREMRAEALREAASRRESIRGLVRMAGLVVMEDVGKTDAAMATAIAYKASEYLRDWLLDRAEEADA